MEYLAVGGTSVTLLGLSYWVLMSPYSQRFGALPIGVQPPRNVVALTFDDGLRRNRDVASSVIFFAIFDKVLVGKVSLHVIVVQVPDPVLSECDDPSRRNRVSLRSQLGRLVGGVQVRIAVGSASTLPPPAAVVAPRHNRPIPSCRSWRSTMLGSS